MLNNIEKNICVYLFILAPTVSQDSQVYLEKRLLMNML